MDGQKKKERKKKGWKCTCPKIPPTTAQTGVNSLVPMINLSRRESVTWDALSACIGIEIVRYSMTATL